MRRYCSVPEIFGIRKYWTKHFNGACKLHDNAYGINSTMSRYKADKILFKSMTKAQTGNKTLNLAHASVAFVFLRLFGRFM